MLTSIIASENELETGSANFFFRAGANLLNPTILRQNQGFFLKEKH